MRAAFQPTKPAPIEAPKSAVRSLVGEVGGVKRASVRLGRSPSTLYAYCDPSAQDEISFAAVAALTDRESPAAAVYLAALAHGTFVPVEPSSDSIVCLQATVLREHGEAMAELVQRGADGNFSADDARAALKQIDEAVEALVQLRCAVAAIISPLPGQACEPDIGGA